MHRILDFLLDVRCPAKSRVLGKFRSLIFEINSLNFIRNFEKFKKRYIITLSTQNFGFSRWFPSK